MDLVLPNLIIAGVTKAATTSLFTYLSAHPDICASRIKETQYFLPLYFGQDLPPLADYAQHFTHCRGSRYRMEATVGYIYGGAPIAAAIRLHLPEPRIIMVLREPVSRLFSFYKFEKNSLLLGEDLSLEEYVRACESIPHEARWRRENHVYTGIEGGLYARYLEAWFDVFEDSELKILFFETMVSEMRTQLGEICAWLGLEYNVYLQNLTVSRENKSVGYKNRTLQDLALKLNWRGEAFWRAHPRLKRVLRRAYYAVNGTQHEEQISEETRAYLESIFKPFNQRLAAQLVHRGYTDLPEWLARETVPR
jgi:hypothetical protein